MTERQLHILVVEDDPKLAHTIVTSLRSEHVDVFRCNCGKEALEYFEHGRADVVVLDLGLPDIDGMEVLEHIRSRAPGIPVLILTARDSVTDRVKGLDAGADDYLIKPISLSELQARVRACTRRLELGRQQKLQCSDLTLDPVGRTVHRSGVLVDMSPREFDLLQYLLEHVGEVVTRSMLARDVWKYNSRVTPIDNIIDVQVSRLREKVDKPFDAPLIQTVRGVGFRITGGEAK